MRGGRSDEMYLALICVLLLLLVIGGRILYRFIVRRFNNKRIHMHATEGEDWGI